MICCRFVHCVAIISVFVVRFGLVTFIHPNIHWLVWVVSLSLRLCLLFVDCGSISLCLFVVVGLVFLASMRFSVRFVQTHVFT